MGYITLTELKRYKEATSLAQLYSLLAEDGTLDEANINLLIDDVSDSIKSQLLGSVDIDDTDPPAHIKYITVLRVLCDLYGRSHDMSDLANEHCKKAEVFINDLVSGKTTIDVDSNLTSDNIIISQFHEERSFDDDTLT